MNPLRLIPQGSQWQLSATAVVCANQQPCRLDYLVVCDAAWQTLAVRVVGWLEMSLSKSNSRFDAPAAGGPNGAECPAAAGGIDLISISVRPQPAAIRRTEFVNRTSSRGTSRLASLPQLTLEPLEQGYRRIGR